MPSPDGNELLLALTINKIQLNWHSERVLLLHDLALHRLNSQDIAIGPSVQV
jgi:hypothetical protein